MRAVYFLLCLALASYTAAHIVRHQLPQPMNTLYAQPHAYVDQYQQRTHVTKIQQRHPESASQSHESREYRESKEYRDNKDYRDSKEHRYSEENRDSKYNSYSNINQYPYSYRTVNQPQFTTVIAQADQIPYGDVIEWEGVQIAAGPNSPVKSKYDIQKIFNDAYKTIQPVSEEDKKRIHQAFEDADQTQQEEAHTNTTQLLQKNKYGVEEHIVKTDDGYYLTMFRIQPKVNQDQAYDQDHNQKHNRDNNNVQQNRPVVMLMHGVLGSADDWLLMGPKKSLAYMLSDAGYDVWLGNTRGNKYSRHHASKHEANPDFWQFSMDEIALHDVPAMIDHALETSHQDKLYYVGHSQGNTVLFALAAARPEYRQKVAMMYALSPMAYMTNSRSPLLRMIAPNNQFYDRLSDKLGQGEFYPSKELVNTVGGNMCNKAIGCKHVCSNIYYVMTGVDTTGKDFQLNPSIVAHLPAGTSTRNIKQYGQHVASHEFRKYDYGASINKKIYGQREPPKYNLTEANVPVTLYSSEEDWLAHPKDVERLRNELPDVREHYKVPEKHFSHMDFQFSERAPEVVYKRLIESIQNN